MNTKVFPAPKGIPARIGQIQCTGGTHVHANQSSPIGARTAAIQTTLTMASGGTLPVSGSFLWALIIRRISGSAPMTIKQPTSRPRNDSPVIPFDQPRTRVKTRGYATKQRYCTRLESATVFSAKTQLCSCAYIEQSSSSLESRLQIKM